MILPRTSQRLECSRRTRILDFPWGTQVGWPLREIGVCYAGMDLLEGRFKAGAHSSETHLLYFVIEGSVICRSDKGSEEVSAGFWMCCPAREPHWISHSRGKAEAVWVHLMDIPRWRFLSLHRACSFPIHDPLDLRHSLARAIHEAEHQDQGSYETAQAYSSIFRICLQREISKAFHQNEPGLRNEITRLWAEVSSSLHEPWTVAQLARRLHVSESALYLHVARSHGLKPMQMVTQLRIERAKDLLLHSNHTLDAIAEEVGYRTAYSFSDAFLRETGMRPGKFRASAQSG